MDNQLNSTKNNPMTKPLNSGRLEQLLSSARQSMNYGLQSVVVGEVQDEVRNSQRTHRKMESTRKLE